MIGYVIGDIIGSRFEFANHKTTDPYDFELFSPACKTTDDTIMSVAVMKTLLDGGDDYERNYAEFGQQYPKKGYGGRFAIWVADPDRKPYQSWGNGSGMRAGPCGWWEDTLEKTRARAIQSALPTHDHPEGIKGAEAIASAIFLARAKKTPDEIGAYIAEQFGYDLNRTTDQIRPGYTFHVSCMKSVPEAIICALESKDFEHAIRLAISIGGDTDTVAAMAGGIAEALHGVPEPILIKAIDFIEPELLQINLKFINAVKSKLAEATQ